MSIRIPPNQIPIVWDAIKFAMVNADNIPEKDRQVYFNRTLQSLLSSKAQCFVRRNEEKRLMALLITRIVADEVTGEKSLHVSSLYSFYPVSIEQWVEDFKPIIEYASKTKCNKITAYANNPKAIEIIEAVGMQERFRSFLMEV
jgi:hypothetical protein